MAARDVRFGVEARAGMLHGLSLAARAAGVGMGPKGRYVAVERDYGNPILRDGVGVIRAIELADRHHQLGVDLARNVAVRCSDRVGDGTKAATLIFHRLVAEGLKAAAAELDAFDFSRGLEAATNAALHHLDGLAKTSLDAPVMRCVATVAANGDAGLGALVAEAVEKAGDDGLLTVRVGSGLETVLTEATGYSLSSKLLSDRLAIPRKAGIREWEDVFVLVVDGRVPAFDTITPLLEAILSENRPLVIVAEEIGPLALAGLVENRRSKVIGATAIRSTLSGDRRADILQDLAIFTGARLLGGVSGLPVERADRAALGTAARVVFTDHDTLFIAGGGQDEAIEARARGLAASVVSTDAGYEQDQLRIRLSCLAGISLTVEVGGATALEAKERRDRIDNATRALKAALTGGVVAGGGVAFIDAATAAATLMKGDPSFDAGVAAVQKALWAPALRILDNAGLDGRPMAARLAGSYPRGIDAATGAERDMFDAGVIDPASVAKEALRIAASAAQTVIRTEAVVIETR